MHSHTRYIRDKGDGFLKLFSVVTFSGEAVPDYLKRNPHLGMKSQSLCFIILVSCPPYVFIVVSVLEAHLGDSTLENPNLSSEVLRMRAEPPSATLRIKGHPAQRM